MRKFAIGCGILTIIVVIVAAIGIRRFVNNMRDMGTDFTLQIVKEGMQDLELPVTQQNHINQRLEDLGQPFQDGKITLQELGIIF